MDELKHIKEKILNEDRIQELLEKLECQHISTEHGGQRYTASLPNGDNKRSLQINCNESLSSTIRSRGIKGDIFTVIGYVLFNCKTQNEANAQLFKAKVWICETLGYQEFLHYDFADEIKRANKVNNPNEWLRKIKKQRKQQTTNLQNEIIDESVFDQYIMFPHLKWIKEGLTYETQQQFQVGYDRWSERIVFPVHNKDGGLIGTKGRYCGSDQQIEDDYKYMYLEPCNKSIELFNLHRALPYIQERKEVFIFEGAKTTFFATQWGYPNCVSMEGDHLTPFQIKLLKDLGLDISYVFAWDKGKTIEFIKSQIESMKNRRVYGIYDAKEMLQDKMSPVDQGEDVWRTLYEQHKYPIYK